jgi:hypothetical protein
MTYLNGHPTISDRIGLESTTLTNLGWIPLTAIVFGSRTKRLVREDITRWGNSESEGEGEGEGGIRSFL